MKSSTERHASINASAISPEEKSIAGADAGQPAGSWSVVRHARLPHRNGLPLSSGGGDAVER